MLDTPRMLARPPTNLLDGREERPICSDGVIPCVCGSMPAGVEYASGILGSDGKPDPMHACVIIKCPKCFRMVMTETVDHAVACWFRVA